MSEEKEKNKTSESEKKAHCPFDKDLACDDCRLFIPILFEGAARGQRGCAFIVAARG